MVSVLVPDGLDGADRSVGHLGGGCSGHGIVDGVGERAYLVGQSVELPVDKVNDNI